MPLRLPRGELRGTPASPTVSRPRVPPRVGGRTVLIDRGFTTTEFEDALRSTGSFEVTGNLHWPDEVDGFTPDPDEAAGLWFARDVPSIAAALGTEPVMIIAATPTDPTILPLPVDSSGIPNDHLQYAITWFLLAAVWVVMTYFFARRLRASDPKGQDT